MKLNARERFEWTSGLLLGLFCIRPGFAALPLLLILVQVVVNIRKKDVRFQFSWPLAGLAALFLAYAIAIVATEPAARIGNELIGKISLLVFPLIFSFRFRESLSLRPVAICLVGGTISAFILSTIHAVQVYRLTHDFNNSFGSTSFSYIHHPSYLAAFFTLTWLLVLQGLREKWRYFNAVNFTIYTLFFLSALLFCFSFAAILFFFLMTAVLLVRILQKKLPPYLFRISLLVLPAIPFVAYVANIHVRIEIDGAVSSVRSFMSNPGQVYEKAAKDPSGNNVRLLMWTVTAEEIRHNPFGYGTAGRISETTRVLQQHDLGEIAEKKYNPHNQFLQTAVETGIPGFLILLTTLILFVRKGIRGKNAFTVWVVANLAFNCLFESMLQRESGIVFYIFLLSFASLSVQNPGETTSERAEKLN